MDQETGRRIAEEVARYPSWIFWAVQGLVTLGAAAVGAFFGEYLKTRGRNLATTADFDRLQNQLSDNTKLVETIKAEVGLRDWVAREWTNLRRVKLEELLNKAADCDAVLNRSLRQIIYTEGSMPTERDVGSELETIATLYFPELRHEVSAVLAVHNHFMLDSAKLAKQLAAARQRGDETARQQAADAHHANLQSRYPDFLQARNQLNDAARKLMGQMFS